MILLDNNSALNLICNKIFKIKIKKSKTKLRVKGNGETVLIKHRSKIPEYNQTRWFSKKAITCIVSLNNTTKQYRVTYDNNNKTFVLHRKEAGLLNMEF